jgi:hypothetical protein
MISRFFLVAGINELEEAERKNFHEKVAFSFKKTSSMGLKNRFLIMIAALVQSFSYECCGGF